MGMRSRRKGKVGERELAELLREKGFEARRGQQFKGGLDSPDVVGLPGVHVEVKRVEALQLWPSITQAKSDAKPGDVPVVFHRSNRRPWIVILDVNDFLDLYRRAEAHDREHLGPRSDDGSP